ncbi:DUF4145 domain-containing protein [Salinimicrobium xinjiangense]|uniref:DUF4145 domain-containing protein n=1 Tax=Salinimicrobium xinjiangense TaxID=438596 RepID=UPI0004281BFD|nr:DUF4145 domain-containing protein [Salinimicrobium xinjiangense]
MTSKEKIKKEIAECTREAAVLLLYLQNKLKADKAKEVEFHRDYQKWYSKALKIVEFLAPDRFQEFKSYYEVDPKRKTMGYGSYYIQDYLKGVAPNSFHNPNFDTKEQTLQNMYNQYTILLAVDERKDMALNDLKSSLMIELQDNELDTAKSLLKVNLRASGVVAGVVLEGYLENVVAHHKLKIAKRNPTLSHYNEALKSNGIYDTTVWRKISYLADIRNICAHKGKEPTKDQVEELIDGVHWTTKNVF